MSGHAGVSFSREVELLQSRGKDISTTDEGPVVRTSCRHNIAPV